MSLYPLNQCKEKQTHFRVIWLSNISKRIWPSPMLQNVWIWKQDCPIWHFQKSMTQKHVSAFCLCWYLPLALFSFAYLGMMGFKSQCAVLGNSASQMITFDLMSKNWADLFNSFASFTFDFVFVYMWRNISNLSGKTKTCLISWKNQ